MKNYQFRLASLLRYRIHQRDMCRLLMAEVMSDQQQVEREEASIEQSRQTSLDEISQMQHTGTFDVSAAAIRRYHAGQMQVDLMQLEKRKRLIIAQVELCRRALMKADQNVRALELMDDKRRQEFDAEMLAKNDREMEETWMAMHVAEFK